MLLFVWWTQVTHHNCSRKYKVFLIENILTSMSFCARVYCNSQPILSFTPENPPPQKRAREPVRCITGLKLLATNCKQNSQGSFQPVLKCLGWNFNSQLPWTSGTCFRSLKVRKCRTLATFGDQQNQIVIIWRQSKAYMVRIVCNWFEPPKNCCANVVIYYLQIFICKCVLSSTLMINCLFSGNFVSPISYQQLQLIEKQPLGWI